MSTVYLQCENCDSRIKPEVYEENGGLCTKCIKRQYPADCFNPRKDMKIWWTETCKTKKTPVNIWQIKYGFGRGRLTAE